MDPQGDNMDFHGGDPCDEHTCMQGRVDASPWGPNRDTSARPQGQDWKAGYTMDHVPRE